MSARDAILGRVRSAQRTGPGLPDVPLYDRNLPELLPQFERALQRMGGTWVVPEPGQSLAACLAQRFPDAARICSAAPELPGTVDLQSMQEPTALHDVDVGIVRAAFGVAETGSVWLSEKELHVNAIGYLVQHLVVLLDPAQIVGNLHHAYQRPEFRSSDYCVLMSGPSATADIEGVLIRGAQGVRSLTVIGVAGG